jgi:hypothetical protein
MAHPAVVKMLPAPRAAAAPPVPVVPGAKLHDELGGFLKFVVGNSPMLIVLTLLMALPWVTDGLVSLLRVFVPYR